MGYKHDWTGTVDQICCRRCGETEYHGYDVLDSYRISQWLDKQMKRRDCKVPRGARLEKPHSMDRQQVFDLE